MVFSSMTFLCVFFPLVFALYYMFPKLRARNILLIIASLLFYAYGEPVYVLLMIFSIVMNYLFGRALDTERAGLRKAALLTAVILNIGLLIVFKYTDMIVQTVNQLTGTHIPMTEIALPIGISFFTFQALSYVIDVYRREVESQKKLLNVMLYVSFFPQLIAGPIVKYHDIQKQIENQTANIQEISEGFRRFTIGLAKKVLISNTVAIAADGIFNTQIGEINILSAWIGAISYMLQIYYDFSGYSDMAIGMGHIFGFHFQENFNYPYISASIKEFWRRWHISLSTWFKEYVYIPLGGNRKGKVRTCINKMIVFAATGLWHGANWTFVLWGIWHGLFLLIEEILPIQKLPGVFRHMYAMLVVCIGFVMFRADTFNQGVQMIGKMFAGWSFDASSMQVAVYWLNPFYIVMLLVGIVGCMPVLRKMQSKIEKSAIVKKIAVPASYVGSVCLLLLSMLSLSSGTYNPFIYFRF